MGHGKLDHETALGLKELRCRLEEDGNRAPPSILDETMNLATSSLVAARKSDGFAPSSLGQESPTARSSNVAGIACPRGGLR